VRRHRQEEDGADGDYRTMKLKFPKPIADLSSIKVE
jgi:hypothetical protein